MAFAAASIPELPARLEYIRSHRAEAPIPVEGLYQKLLRFADELDDTGHLAADRILRRLEPVKRALGFRAEVGESLLSTLFEELLLGGALFEEAFGPPASLTSCELGFVEDTEVVITESTLRDLEALLGGRRLGVASGSIWSTAYHALGSFAHMIPREAQVWHDDVDKASETTGRGDLHKPNPYPLVAACELYRPYRCVLYVGDTATDHLMARRAGGGFLFAGVYGVAHGAEETKRGFLEAGCDIVAPSVNHLPEIISTARRLRPGG